MLRIELELEGVIAPAVLFEEQAPKTCAKVWALLPITDRTIQVRWSGGAWRTEQNYPLQIGAVENPITVLEAGDIIYYDDPRYNLYKIGVAYARAAWREFAGDLTVAHIGRLTGNLEAFNQRGDRIIVDGPKTVRIRRAG